MQLKTIVLIACIGYGAFHAWQGREVTHGPGVLAPNSPTQTAANTHQTIQMQGYTITPLARIELQARVLSKTSYHMGREADLSPVDLALGWGAMSDETNLSQISISQSNRIYFWNVKDFPIPREEIETHSANMHLIPASKSIEKMLNRVRKGQLVTIRGDLIEAKASDGWSWRSSLSREDTGSGACEVVLVKSLEIDA